MFDGFIRRARFVMKPEGGGGGSSTIISTEPIETWGLKNPVGSWTPTPHKSSTLKTTGSGIHSNSWNIELKNDIYVWTMIITMITMTMIIIYNRPE